MAQSVTLVIRPKVGRVVGCDAGALALKPQLDVCIDGGVEPLRRDNGVGHLIVVVPQPLVLVERIGLVLQVKQALAFQLAMPGVIVVVDPDDQVQIILVILVAHQRGVERLDKPL